MKLIKVIALAGIAAFAVNASAQEYAPKANDFSLEIQFNPFSNNFTTFKLDQIKGRVFLTDKDALRLGLGFGVGTHKSTPNVADDAKDNWEKTTQGSFSINLGYERNVYSYKRINLYAGAGLGFEMNRVSVTAQSKVAGETFKSTAYNQSDDKLGDSYNQFYVNGFTGIDFFVYKGLYLGAELGLKIGVTNFPSEYTKGGINPETGNWSDSWESEKGPKSNDFMLKLYAEPAIRLGWQF